MPVIVERFSGIAPKIEPRQLNEQLGQIAIDCLVDRLSLRSMPDTVDTGDDVSTLASTIYKRNGAWLAFDNVRDIVNAPIANDPLDRYVVADPDTYPSIKSGGSSYRLGIPEPATAPILSSITAPSDVNALDAETVSYVTTFVDAWGSEGPPSVASLSTDRERDTDVTVSLPAVPGGNYNFGAGALHRVYRSNSGTSGSNYQFVLQIAITATSVVDTVDNDALGELMPSLEWIGPPDDDIALYPNGAMQGITDIGNGVLAGFSHRTVVFCEPFLPHAWPVNYRITLDQDIVGITATTSGLLVTTVTKPHLIVGVHPASLVLQDLQVPQACVAKQGQVDMGKYALYPSPDGLVLVDGGTAKVVTEELFTREQWQAFSPETINAHLYEGKYMAFFDNGVKQGFMFDPRGGLHSFCNMSQWFEAAFYEAVTDLLFVKETTGDVLEFGSDYAVPLSYTWRSKIYILPRPVSLAVVRVVAAEAFDVSPVTVKIYAGGVLVDTVVLDDAVEDWGRLSSGILHREYEFEISGSNAITYVGLYESMEDMG